MIYLQLLILIFRILCVLLYFCLQFPDFTLDSQLGPISYHALIEGKWGLIITFHKAFDPVTTTVSL